MRSKLILATVAAVAISTLSAFAATSPTTGEIKAFDLKAGTITLVDGTVYMLPKGFVDPGLKVGEKVTIAWTEMNKMMDATAVTIVK